MNKKRISILVIIFLFGLGVCFVLANTFHGKPSSQTTTEARSRQKYVYDREKCLQHFASNPVVLEEAPAESGPSNEPITGNDRGFYFAFSPKGDEMCYYREVEWYLVYGRTKNPTWDANHYWYVKTGRYTASSTTVRDLAPGAWHFRACALVGDNASTPKYNPDACIYSQDLEITIP